MDQYIISGAEVLEADKVVQDFNNVAYEEFFKQGRPLPKGRVFVDPFASLDDLIADGVVDVTAMMRTSRETGPNHALKSMMKAMSDVELDSAYFTIGSIESSQHYLD